MTTEYILRIIDFETTGIPEEGVEHSVVEMAHIDFSAETKERIRDCDCLVVPTTDMDITAQAVHHISFHEACQGIPWDVAVKQLSHKTDNQELIFVAHNADYEKQFFNPDGSKWIDTYKVALKIYQDAPKHSNQVLKYYLEIADRPEHHPPHRALPDCEVTAEILMIMAEKVSFNEMIQISKQAPYITKMPFGKYYGQKFGAIPLDYLKWLVNQSDIDAGVKAGAHRVIGARKA